MSDTVQPAPDPVTASSDDIKPLPPQPEPVDDFGYVAKVLGTEFDVMKTVLHVMVPGIGDAIETAIGIAKGVVAGVPAAVALYRQFQSDTPPRQSQLDAYAKTEQAAYEKAMSAVTEKLKG